MAIHLPSGSAVYLGIRAEDLAKAPARALELARGPVGVFMFDVILPAHVIVRVDAHLEASVLHLAHDLRAAPADVRPGQQRPVEQGTHSVVRDDRRAAYFLEESLAEDAFDRTAGVIRPQTEQKRGAGFVLAQKLYQARHAVARSAIGVDVDLES